MCYACEANAFCRAYRRLLVPCRLFSRLASTMVGGRAPSPVRRQKRAGGQSNLSLFAKTAKSRGRKREMYRRL